MVFRVFDRQGKGKLDKTDVAAAVSSLGKRAVPNKIAAFFEVHMLPKGVGLFTVKIR